LEEQQRAAQRLGDDIKANGGEQLPADVEPGSNLGAVVEKYKGIIRQRLGTANGLTIAVPEPPVPIEPPAPTEPPEAIDIEGWKGWRGFSRWFRNIIGKKEIKMGGKFLPWLGVAMAKDEGEAGFAVATIFFCASNPAIGIACGVVGVGVIGVTIGRALYRWWKGPEAEIPPNIELPVTEPIEYPDRHVEHVEQPPPEPEPPAPDMIHLSITKRYPGD